MKSLELAIIKIITVTRSFPDSSACSASLAYPTRKYRIETDFVQAILDLL
ncbi:MAG: hypothetical protein AB4063_21870 [Crocosphaera sp.]